jgi:aspartyl-tRNA(Asn)/glutamyl-tRNA(Gln) amidotransferase subunit C
MSRLTTDQVRHIAKLARLRLSDEEVESMSGELSSILGYIDMLSELDTTHVEPTAQVTGMSTILREDIICPLHTSPDALLACSSLPLVDHQISTPSAHG